MPRGRGQRGRDISPLVLGEIVKAKALYEDKHGPGSVAKAIMEDMENRGPMAVFKDAAGYNPKQNNVALTDETTPIDTTMLTTDLLQSVVDAKRQLDAATPGNDSVH